MFHMWEDLSLDLILKIQSSAYMITQLCQGVISFMLVQ